MEPSAPFRTAAYGSGDISVVEVDDILLAEFISPRLSTIRQPLKEMGDIAPSTHRSLQANSDYTQNEWPLGMSTNRPARNRIRER